MGTWQETVVRGKIRKEIVTVTTVTVVTTAMKGTSVEPPAAADVSAIETAGEAMVDDLATIQEESKANVTTVAK
jgi:hypothetical protein